jgi:PAS domain S-box-containing protein
VSGLPTPSTITPSSARQSLPVVALRRTVRIGLAIAVCFLIILLLRRNPADPLTYAACLLLALLLWLVIGHWLQRSPAPSLTANDNALQHFREVHERVDLISLMVDVAGSITFCNDFLLTLTGWSRNEILGRNWFELFTPADEMERVRAHHELIMTTGVPLTQGKTTVLTRAGARRLVHWHVTALRDQHGAVIGTACIGEDITDRINAEVALRASEETLRTLLNALPDFLFRVDRHGVFLDTKEADAERLLMPPRDFIGKHIEDVLPAEVAQLAQQHIDRALTTREQQCFEYAITVQGEEHAFEARIVMLNGDELLVVVRDVTEYRNAVRALRASEAKYRSLVEHLPAMTYVIEPAYGIHASYVSPQIATLLGFTTEEWLADHNNFARHVHPDDRPRIIDNNPFLRDTESYTGEYRMYTKDGRLIWVHDEAVIVRDEDEQPRFIQGFLIDITEHKHAQEREKLLARMQESERLRSEFLSLVSHELRTPLTPVRGTIDLLAEGHLGPINTQQSQALEVARWQVIRLQQLINDLLDLSSLETGKIPLNFTAINLGELVAERCAVYEKYCSDRNIYLRTECLVVSPVVQGDRQRLGQVLDNLLENAAKFTRTGGVTVRLLEEDAMVRMEVIDTGIGLAPEDCERIFDRFVQIAPQRTLMPGGSGLGLAIVRQLTEVHGGQVWAESAGLHQGATVIVRLPRAAVSSEDTAPA